MAKVTVTHLPITSRVTKIQTDWVTTIPSHCVLRLSAM